jgi:hypothetical protein
MHPLYETLEDTTDIGDRRIAIQEYMNLSRMMTLIPPGGVLLPITKVPYEDNATSFNFVLGNKYLKDEPYDRQDHFAYVIGFTRMPGEEDVQLLVVDPEKTDVYRRKWMDPPEFMMMK